MNDDFLYKLRVDPPKSFAIRLKARLDRGSGPGKWLGSWGLTLLICGAAFALALPGVRHSIVQLFASPLSSDRAAQVVQNPATAPRESSPASLPPGPTTTEGTAGDKRNRRDPLATSSASTGAVIPLQTPPQPSASIVPALPSPEIVAPRVVSVPAGESTGAITPEPAADEETAREAIATRRGLFRVMGWAMEPLDAMLQNRMPVDAQTATREGTRIQTLASMIGAVFQPDTRRFVLETQAREKIWTQMPEFDREADELAASARSLSAVASARSLSAVTSASARSATLQAIQRVRTSCGACHEAYLTTPTTEAAPQ